MNWSDTPPTVAGWYWVKTRRSGHELPVCFCGRYWHVFGEYESGVMAARYQFGPRIPSADELAALPGLIQEYAVACRLHELAQLHDEQARFTAGFRQPTSGHATAQARLERCRELLAKINAILGVAE